MLRLVIVTSFLLLVSDVALAQDPVPPPISIDPGKPAGTDWVQLTATIVNGLILVVGMIIAYLKSNKTKAELVSEVKKASDSAASAASHAIQSEILAQRTHALFETKSKVGPSS